MSLCYLSVVISIVAGVNLYDVDDYYLDEIIITTAFSSVSNDDLNILLNGNLHVPVPDLIVSLSLCLTDVSETSQASTGDSSITTTLSSVSNDDLNILSNGNLHIPVLDLIVSLSLCFRHF